MASHTSPAAVIASRAGWWNCAPRRDAGLITSNARENRLVRAAPFSAAGAGATLSRRPLAGFAIRVPVIQNCQLRKTSRPHCRGVSTKLRVSAPVVQYSPTVPGSELAARVSRWVSCCSRRTPIWDAVGGGDAPPAAPVAPRPHTPRSALIKVERPSCLPAPIRVVDSAVPKPLVAPLAAYAVPEIG